MRITPRRDYMLSLESVVMTDIVLNMFIFFFISFSLLYTFSKNPGIKVALPMSKTAAPYEENMTVFISSDDEIFFDNRKVNIDELGGILKERLDAAKKKIVVLKSDKKVDLGLAVKVMDSAKQAGAGEVVISTTREDDGGR